MALNSGDKITGFEGIDFGGNKYAIVLDADPTEDGKVLLSLYFPESNTARKYKVPANLSGIVDPTPPYDKGPENPNYDIPESSVDMLRLRSPDRSRLPIRNIPDSYFPDDPNYPSTITDVLWRPQVRRTPMPRFYNFRRQTIAHEGNTRMSQRFSKRAYEQLCNGFDPNNDILNLAFRHCMVGDEEEVRLTEDSEYANPTNYPPKVARGVVRIIQLAVEKDLFLNNDECEDITNKLRPYIDNPKLWKQDQTVWEITLFACLDKMSYDEWLEEVEDTIVEDGDQIPQRNWFPRSDVDPIGPPAPKTGDHYFNIKSKKHLFYHAETNKWVEARDLLRLEKGKSGSMRQRRRRIAFTTLGPYFESVFPVNFVDLFNKMFRTHSGAQELYDLDLTTFVGRECKELIDSTSLLTKLLKVEDEAAHVKSLANILMDMFALKYYG